MSEQEIFMAALEGPSERRSAFLDAACAGDATLRERLARLLEIHGRATDFLEDPAVAMPTTQLFVPIDEGPGNVVGPYKLLEKIGEGGFGIVFLAEQAQPVRRKVALKILKPGMDSRQFVARFEAERQALALMDHPNIARIFDGGVTPSGRPFFAMELVKGVPITRFCDENRLTPRERLALFVTVCQAVQHAHQKGIIHRDLKPSNVLVSRHDATPVVKVIDFGVAKAMGQELTDKTLFTGFAQMIGTPQYMSPEQAGMSDLDVDTRTDIYSLGVLLYELLTGSTPFSRERLKKAAYDEIRRIIREEEPPKPSTRLTDSQDSLTEICEQRHTPPAKLAKLLRGELDWIVMKALEKDRNRRYETPNSFALDVQRYLGAEPVLAGPPSARYRLRKYAQRHMKALVTAALFLALLVAGAVASAVLAAWALRERANAQREQQSAETNLKRALSAVNQMLTRVGSIQLVNIPQMAPVRRELLQDALRFYQEFLKEKGDSPVVRAEAANVYRNLGMIQHQLGLPKEAEESYRQAIALAERLRAEAPNDPDALDALACIHNDLAVFYQTGQQYAKSVEVVAQGVALRERIDQLSPSYPNNRRNLAAFHCNLVSTYRMAGQLPKAEAAFQKSNALAEELLRADPQNLNALTLVASAHQNMALVYGAMDRLAEAEATHLKAAELTRELIRRAPDTVYHQKQLAGIFNNLGLLYANRRDHAKADAAYRESLALNEAVLRDNPKIVPYQVDVATSCSNMATHIRRSRSAEESLPWSARAIEIAEPVLAGDPKNGLARGCLFDVYYGRANALVDLKRPDEADKEWRRLIELSAGQPNITMRLFRPPPLARLGEHALAAAEMEALLAEGLVPPQNVYTFSYVYARCAGAAAKDSRLAPAEQERLADRYGARSVELLKKAQAAGYFKDPARLARMKENQDFNAVRGRDDFQKALAELEKEPTAKPPAKPPANP